MRLEQAYLKVKRDLVWLQEVAKYKDKINLYKPLQTDMPNGSRQLA